MLRILVYQLSGFARHRRSITSAHDAGLEPAHYRFSTARPITPNGRLKNAAKQRRLGQCHYFMKLYETIIRAFDFVPCCRRAPAGTITSAWPGAISRRARQARRRHTIHAPSPRRRWHGGFAHRTASRPVARATTPRRHTGVKERPLRH